MAAEGRELSYLAGGGGADTRPSAGRGPGPSDCGPDVSGSAARSEAIWPAVCCSLPYVGLALSSNVATILCHAHGAADRGRVRPSPLRARSTLDAAGYDDRNNAGVA